MSAKRQKSIQVTIYRSNHYRSIPMLNEFDEQRECLIPKTCRDHILSIVENWYLVKLANHQKTK